MENFIVLITAKTPNEASFLALTPEHKVQLICAWSHFVGLIDSWLFIYLETPTYKHDFISFKTPKI